jgi:hypothetical protein
VNRTLGTPDELSWPGVSSLKDYNPDFPRWPARALESVCPTLDPLGMDLLKVRLTVLCSPLQLVIHRDCVAENVGVRAVSSHFL